MNTYKVNINSKGNGWSENISTEAEISLSGGAVIIRYTLDGDECALTVSNGTVTQERRGGQNVKIAFEEGKRTRCEIGSGDFSGSFDVLTKSIKFISGKGGYKLSLEYINGSDRELVQLSFTAVKKGIKNEN